MERHHSRTSRRNSRHGSPPRMVLLHETAGKVRQRIRSPVSRQQICLGGRSQAGRTAVWTSRFGVDRIAAGEIDFSAVSHTCVTMLTLGPRVIGALHVTRSVEANERDLRGEDHAWPQNRLPRVAGHRRRHTVITGHASLPHEFDRILAPAAVFGRCGSQCLAECSCADTPRRERARDPGATLERADAARRMPLAAG